MRRAEHDGADHAKFKVWQENFAKTGFIPFPAVLATANYPSSLEF